MTTIEMLPDTLSIAERVGAGDLLDVTDEAARLGFRHRVLLTSSAWTDSVWWDEVIEEMKYGQSTEEVEGRLRDVLWVARWNASRSRGRVAYFDHARIPPYGADSRTRTVTLVMSISPDDNGRPVIVIGLGEEGPHA